MRKGAWILLLIAGASLAAPRLKDLLDPRHESFRLQAYKWEEWKDLDKATKLKAKAIDPAEWVDPPPDPPDPEEEKKREEKKKKEEERRKKGIPPQYPRDRVPGFRFDERLTQKKQAFEELVQPASASKLEGLIKQLRHVDKLAAKFEKQLANVTEEYVKVREQLDKATEWQIKKAIKKTGKPPAQVMVPAALKAQHDGLSRKLQRMIAVQQSERQFRRWLIFRTSELISQLSDAERAKPLAALKAGMADKDWRHRLRCAEILGRLGDAQSKQVFADALETEADPMVLADLIRIRARRGGTEIVALLVKRLGDERWPVRAAVIGELGKIPRKESVDALVAQLEKEDGRLRDDITGVLRRITGQNFQPEPDPWRIWWEKHRAKWTPVKPGTDAAGEAEAQKAGNVYFYGIRTSSKRLVFCIDLSGSMAFPLDGQEGKKPPRIETARRELFQAFAALPEEALFNVVTYNSTVRVWKKRMQPATLKNKLAARKFVEKITPAGATNIYDALNVSLDIAVAGGARKKKKDAVPEADTVFFLSDGQPTNGRVVDPHQILKEITNRNQLVGAVIHTVGVSKEQNAGFMLNLAKRNGGRYVGHR